MIYATLIVAKTLHLLLYLSFITIFVLQMRNLRLGETNFREASFEMVMEEWERKVRSRCSLEPMPLIVMSCFPGEFQVRGGDRNSELLNFRLVCTCLIWLFKVSSSFRTREFDHVSFGKPVAE